MFEIVVSVLFIQVCQWAKARASLIPLGRKPS